MIVDQARGGVGARPRHAALVLGAILLVALLLRLRGLAFGLPALLDPDEPIFVLNALKLLKDHTLNPGWFGHPGTTTIYTLALVEIGVYLFGHATGRFTDPQAFTQAIYHDPTIVFLPGRVFILACSLATIVLTYQLAKRLFGCRVGLLTAALLAVDPVHIRYSQIIRTDMHAAVFVLLGMIAACRVAERGRGKDYILAGICLGLACATKWPAGTVAAAVIGASALRWRLHPGECRLLVNRLAIFLATGVGALIVASPYLVLDWPTVVSNLHGERRVHHLGATGGTAAANIWWYVSGPFRSALGGCGVALALGGMIVGARQSQRFAFVIVPTAAAFLGSVIFQHLVWERWVVPILPLVTLASAVAAAGLVEFAGVRLGTQGRWSVAAAIGVVLVVPPALTANAQAAERATDTRRLASDWARRHVPPGSSVAIEFLAFDVLDQPWRFLYPAGDQGCVDVRANLNRQVRVETIGAWRHTSPVVDFGTISSAAVNTCRADYLIVADLDRYRAERGWYETEIATYRHVIGRGEQVAMFAPVPGRIGGPLVRVYREPPPVAASPLPR